MTVLDRDATFSTLPREFYLDDAALFETEMERIWYRRWLFLAHESELPEPGDYVVRRLLGENVVVVRTPSGGLAALLNVCRHRGARIVDAPCGTLKRFVCPYHQWTYDLDGRLVGAPSMPDGEIEYDALGLYRLPLESWHGMVFACLGDDAPEPLAPQIAKLVPELDRYEPERLRKVAERTYACEANWKVMLENYLECYHCSASHPEFCRTADLRVRASAEYQAQSYDEHPYWGVDIPLREGTKTVSLSGERVCRVPLAGGDEFVLGRSRTFGDWAAASVLYFYADYAMAHQIVPVSATRTDFRLTWFLDRDAQEDDYDVEEVMAVWDATTRQDVELIERTQDGLRSRRYEPGPLSERHEPYIRSSLNLYLAAIGGTADGVDHRQLLARRVDDVAHAARRVGHRDK